MNGARKLQPSKLIDFVAMLIKGSQLKEIGFGAFMGSSLESIIIPAAVVNIDDYAFAFCEKLEKHITFENGSQLESLGKMFLWIVQI